MKSLGMHTTLDQGAEQVKQPAEFLVHVYVAPAVAEGFNAALVVLVAHVLDTQAFRPVGGVQHERFAQARVFDDFLHDVQQHGSESVKGDKRYLRYTCSAKCGAPQVRMEAVDSEALNYLHAVLSPESRTNISTALLAYQNNARSVADDFTAAAKREIAAKQRQYDALLSNLSSGSLPASVVSDIGQKMQALKNEMDALAVAPPPRDYTAEQIQAWLQSLESAPDELAIHLLVDRITVYDAMDIRLTSTLPSVVGDAGWGSRI